MCGVTWHGWEKESRMVGLLVCSTCTRHISVLYLHETRVRHPLSFLSSSRASPTLANSTQATR
jgi:hypothetical protein